MVDFTNVTWVVSYFADNDTYIYRFNKTGIASMEIEMAFSRRQFEYTYVDYNTTILPYTVQFWIRLADTHKYTDYEVGYQIKTIYKSDSECSDPVTHFHYEIYAQRRFDMRWFTFMKADTALYARHSSRCLDGAAGVQSCPLDILESPLSESKGEGYFLVRIPAVNRAVRTYFDMLIISTNDSFLNYTKSSCFSLLRGEPLLTGWLLPSMVPLIVVCLGSFAVVIVFILIMNRKALTFGIMQDADDSQSSDLSDTEETIKETFDIDQLCTELINGGDHHHHHHKEHLN
ncbi:hypothetical protein SAMD00019534_028290 [Acytostelium subglobosum LB1]|uniref:hypothetical protein n=1 Tax=Acytostelium subglobosum LB1 TaxID=1410327 RepID=UPI0006450A30|nr:hypothetical protein SAMD00019534_028290 [Acytostelium subglobosum LB1]GAM19654.1 hypothetical protein SAMD00019534_028290 [Acytostelium subglobosum LB1]|eukprot:XP_012756416.1 hypothetical protein SAMD00019534_028290 [Acytostelium subglobosum LB1]